MGEIKNPVLDYNWEKDISSVPEPQRSFIFQKPMEISDNGVIHGIYTESIPKVQAEPSDIITIKTNDGMDKSYHAHPITWMYTLDRYINQYYCLCDMRNSYRGEIEWMNFLLPNDIIDMHKRQIKECIEDRKKLPVKWEYIEAVCHNAKELTEGEIYRVPESVGSVYLQHYCRSMMTRKNNVKAIHSLQHDGLIYRPKDGDDFIPPFKLVDYYLHEAITGVSLSIEIAAVILEVKRRLNNEVLWDKAFDTFCSKALTEIVKSPMYFTRNAAARYFFQQILMEQTICDYGWNSKDKWKTDTYWSELTDRALNCCKMLKYAPYPIEVPETQTEESIAHIEHLLNEVEKPINFRKYINHPTHGLAVFCNPDHEYVSKYLNELARIESNGSSQTTKKKCINKQEREQFVAVHKMVKKAIQEG